MSTREVIQAMLEVGVTSEEFYHFITTYGIQDDPWISEVLQHIIIDENTADSGSPMRFDADDADELLQALNSPVSDSFEPWSPGLTEEVLRMDSLSS